MAHLGTGSILLSLGPAEDVVVQRMSGLWNVGPPLRRESFAAGRLGSQETPSRREFSASYPACPPATAHSLRAAPSRPQAGARSALACHGPIRLKKVKIHRLQAYHET